MNFFRKVLQDKRAKRRKAAKPRREYTMNSLLKTLEDKRTIGTRRYQNFQKICSEAGYFAAKEARARGLPLTYVKNNDIIKEYADGKIVILGKVKPSIKARLVYNIP